MTEITPGEHIDLAKTALANGQPADNAIAHALVAIAEIMAINVTDALIDATARGAGAAAEAFASVANVAGLGFAQLGANITAEGAAVVESGLTLRQAHELKTGCSADNPCAECRRIDGT